jgi:hypothetical protein
MRGTCQKSLSRYDRAILSPNKNRLFMKDKKEKMVPKGDQRKKKTFLFGGNFPKTDDVYSELQSFGLTFFIFIELGE